MQKNQNPKATTGKANPLPVVLLLTVSARMRSFGSCDTKKARDASPPPQDDLWVVVKNLSQQVAAQQAEMDALRNTIALQQKATANLEKILRQYGKSGSVNHLANLRKAMQGARIRTSAVRDIRWISRQVWTRLSSSPSSLDSSSPKQQTRISSLLFSSFAAKTVTTIQRSPDVKARNFLRSSLASIGGKTLEVATAEATKIRVQTPGFRHINTGDSPQGVSPSQEGD
ncbi:hypothetical protein BASA83_013065 [Batrachochytrium salamandrivorans]|nr:hypothetical protein BASA83_013065 [Batrachochytrium salamandrivorans]